MSMTIFFKDNSYLPIVESNRHMTIPVNLYNVDETIVDRKYFILDTGAEVMTISRETVKIYGFDKITPKETTIVGFGGEEQVHVIIIPKMEILNISFYDIPVIVPINETNTIEVIGLNVLRYLDYYIDNTADKMYIKKTYSPKPYKPDRAPKEVLYNEE